MRCGRIVLALGAGVVIGLSGCLLTEAARPVTRYMKNTFNFQGTDYNDPTEEDDEVWISEAAKEGRPNQRIEKDPDQWWRKYVMSEKARSIERNLGFE